MNQNRKIALMIMKQIELSMQNGRAKQGLCVMFLDRLARINKRCPMPFQMTVDVREVFDNAMKTACKELGYNETHNYPIPGVDGMSAFDTYHKYLDTNHMWDTGEYGMKRRILFYNIFRQLGGIS